MRTPALIFPQNSSHPGNVISAAIFSAVSTASYTMGTWQKYLLSFRFLCCFWKALNRVVVK